METHKDGKKEENLERETLNPSLLRQKLELPLTEFSDMQTPLLMVLQSGLPPTLCLDVSPLTPHIFLCDDVKDPP